MVYYPDENVLRYAGGRLPCAVSNDKTSGCIIKNKKLYLLNSVSYNVDSKIGYKNGMY